jgi:tetratricopeptide (TPR) repeat protein
MSGAPVKIFISYSKADNDFIEVFIDRFRKHFTAEEYFSIWDESMIIPGSNKKKEKASQLAAADMAILCVSANFINDPDTDTKEFISLSNSPGKPWIIPVYFSPCNKSVWETLAARYSFRPSGENYNFTGNQKEFSFCDLVHFSQTDRILIPDNKKEKYFLDLLAEIKTILDPQVAEDVFKKQIAADDPLHYINPGNYPYFERDSFFGRDDLLKEIDDKLKELDTPLLLSGIGGMGKTAVAIAYGKNKLYASGYDHIAWVNVTGDIFTSLFSTFQGNSVVPFEYSRDGDREKDSASIMQLLKLVHGNNLLLFDNCNTENELKEFIKTWKIHQPGWKCMVTTRCDMDMYKNQLIRLQVMPPEAAEKLFKYHNNDEVFDNASFKKIYDYIGGHTFLVELLAKFGSVNSKVNSTDDILKHLQTKGIKELTKAVVAKQGQQQESDKLVSEFVLGLYDPQILEEKKKEYMRYFSLLPAAEIEFDKLAYLFDIKKEQEESFDDTLISLARSGWLISNKGSFKCHQIIKQICREKLSPDQTNTAVLLNTLGRLFAEQNIAKAIPWFEIGFTITREIEVANAEYANLLINMADMAKLSGDTVYIRPLLEKAYTIFYSLNDSKNVSGCLEREGDFRLLKGYREEAMDYYTQYNTLVKNMITESPDEPSNKYLLAISLFKMGEVYQADNKLTEAMNHFEQVRVLSKELVEKYPADIVYKNSLAGTLSRIGEIHQANHEMTLAMNAYVQFNNIEEELVKQSPDNKEYKNNLSISYCKLGEMCQDDNKPEAALDWFKKYNTAKKELADADPENVVYQNGLAVTYSRLAPVSAGEEKKNYLSAAKAIWDALVEKVPENVSYKSSQTWVNTALKEAGD